MPQKFKLITRGKVVIVFLLAIFSCTTAPKTAPLPAWYINPTQNDLTNLYGTGEGYTLQEATRSALNNLAGKLLVTVSSTTSTLAQENNFSVSTQSSRQIDELITKTTFSNYQISKSSSTGDKIYAEIQVNRDEFVKERIARLAQLNRQMNDLYNTLERRTILDRRNDLAKINNFAEEARAINYILAGLAVVEIKNNSDLVRYELYKKQYDQVTDKIEFFIKLNDSPAGIARVLTKAINAEKMKLLKNNDRNTNAVIIDVRTDVNQQIIYNSKVAKLRITFNLLSSENKIISSNVVELMGNSVISGEEAINAAVSGLEDKIKDDGLLKTLGIFE